MKASKEDISILQILRHPEFVIRFGLREWNSTLRQARNTQLLPRLAVELAHTGFAEDIPEKVRSHLQSGSAIAEQHARITRWELSCIAEVLAPQRIPVILLKGSAYLISSLPCAKGRLSCDIDILVPKSYLEAVETELRRHGWETVNLDPYDQRYYRQWMHELPPLRHRDRHTVLDVHHTILPESGRLHPDAAELIRSAIPVQGTIFSILAPGDLVLHCAAHMFQDGDLAGGLRNLLDIDDLLRHYSRESGFWGNLVPRARDLDLTRPLFYALRYTNSVLGTPVPSDVMKEASRHSPPGPVLAAMDWFVRRALVPLPRETAPAGVAFSRWVLYVRSHWLRMPPGLLARHLSRKVLRRWIEMWEKRDEAQDMQHAKPDE
jgi:hypothetical protein